MTCYLFPRVTGIPFLAVFVTVLIVGFFTENTGELSEHCSRGATSEPQPRSKAGDALLRA